MLKRKITEKLLNWKNNEDNICLLVRGARQVGKTYIIDEFAKKNYKSYIYINFELEPSYKSIFDGNLDIKTLKMKLELSFPNTPLISNNTIIFLDEIQACPNARTALKSFAMDNTMDVIASGSLLGLYYKEIASYPVLDFEEFLWAIGVKDEIIDVARNSFNNLLPLDEYILNQFEEYFKMYLLVGGMPKIVETYTQNNSLIKVLELQKSIVENYKMDILKYANEPNKQKIISCFNSIPSQLTKVNKKFLYKDIIDANANEGERKYSSSLEWLRDAGIINVCNNLTEPASPLVSNVIENNFKIYVRDTGLLISMFEQGVQKDILNENLYINEGAILENVCAEEIKTRYDKVMYFQKKSKLEIDFILNIDGKVTALEVKSGNNKQAKSLKSIVENYKTVSRYIKLEKGSNVYIDETNIEHYPLFMIMFI